MSLLKNIPKVDKILETVTVRELLEKVPRAIVVAAVRNVLKEVRQAVLNGTADMSDVTDTVVAGKVAASCAAATTASLRRVVNGTGIVIHTNLGRSILPEAAREPLLNAAFNPTNLELDLESGTRGDRYDHVAGLLCELTGAEAALVVNNNAAAVLLALSALAAGRDVVVSRGELVEIGGSFRIPEVMEQSGAILREVGTTNRTHLRDYRAAISPATALLLKVHTSNYAVVGFTASVESAALADLGREEGLPVMVDLGSGSLVDLSMLPGCREPHVRELIRERVDVVTFSGDKLLGGPQAGIIVGRRDLIDGMKRHPLLRALRIDKLTLAALEATLRLYRDERLALAEVPTLRRLLMSETELSQRADLFLKRLRRSLPAGITVTLQPGVSQVGGGSLPLLELPTVLLAVNVPGRSAAEVDSLLRSAATPILGRINRGTFLLDTRTIHEHEIPVIASALATLS